MKKNFTLLTFLFVSIIYCNAQTPLPYYTAFDNAAQQAGWIDYRKGFLSGSDWTYNSFSAYSAPNSIHHDYPVGSANTDTTVDWYVSPAFNFSNGGMIDSIRVNIYSITGQNTPVDELGLYLLVNNGNPSLATSTIHIAELKSFVSSSNVWQDTGNFAIPPTPGLSYLGIKYRATNNWFVTDIDNIHLSGLTGIDDGNNPANNLVVFPNPANDYLEISLPTFTGTDFEISIFNTVGQEVVKQKCDRGINKSRIDISKLYDGIYFVQATSNTKTTYKQKFVVAK